MRIIIAWIKKYILHVHSPSAHARGYDFEYDYIKDMKNKRIRDLEHQITELSLRISELEAELEESRAKEGKGCLEKMLDGIADAISSIDFSAIDFSSISAMNHPELLDDNITIEGDDDNAI